MPITCHDEGDTGSISMNYYRPILTRSDERAPVWMEVRASMSKKACSPHLRLVPDSQLGERAVKRMLALVGLLTQGDFVPLISLRQLTRLADQVSLLIA